MHRVTRERLEMLIDLGESGTMGNNPFGIEKFNLAKDLRDTRAALAASEAREKGLREALAQSTNYTANHESQPTEFVFANGRRVWITREGFLDTNRCGNLLTQAQEQKP